MQVRDSVLPTRNKSLPGPVLAVLLVTVLAIVAGTVIAIDHPLLLVPLFAAGSGLIVARSPKRAFLLGLAALPLEAALVLDLGITLQISFVLSWMSGLAGLVSGQLRTRRTPLDRPLLTLMGLTLASLFVAIIMPRPNVQFLDVLAVRSSVFRPAIQFFKLVSFIFFYYQTVWWLEDEAMQKQALRALLIGGSISVAYGIYQFFALSLGLPFADINNALNTDLSSGSFWSAVWPTTQTYIVRVWSTFPEPANFGWFLTMLWSFFLAARVCFHMIKPTWRPWVTCGLIGSGVALLMTLSTSGLAAAIAASTILLLLVIRHKPRSVAKTLILLSIVIIVSSVLMSLAATLSARDILQLFTDRLVKRDLSSESRFLKWEYNRWLFLQYPILGVGIGNGPIYRAALAKANTLVPAFSIWWAALVETGILGFLVLGWLVLAFYRTTLPKLEHLREIGSPAYPWLLGGIAGFSGLLVAFSVNGDGLPIYAWGLLGLTMSYCYPTERS